jgi:hypothetical protein
MDTSSIWAASVATASLLAAIAACIPEASSLHRFATAINGPRVGLDPRRRLIFDIGPGEKHPPAQACLVGTRSCLTLTDRPPSPCLLSTRRCPDEGQLELIHAATH